MEMTARLVGYMMRTALQSSKKLERVRARVAQVSHCPLAKMHGPWNPKAGAAAGGQLRSRHAWLTLSRLCSIYGWF